MVPVLAGAIPGADDTLMSTRSFRGLVCRERLRLWASIVGLDLSGTVSRNKILLLIYRSNQSPASRVTMPQQKSPSIPCLFLGKISQCIACRIDSWPQPNVTNKSVEGGRILTRASTTHRGRII